ncbi:membrane or secreted protein [Blastopirellula sp. J2-11]|uniref:membrane or secreted protein n=1 Tax=Blastopirellula sp. J2-11 TaxID=2943192 RepID=UPI0021C99023|nr:membrane or secreted protein [Blastopirellula sp. J2-11]UUO08180.1 membrane or secreted protein [Blastopirellula sp. J2-11]
MLNLRPLALATVAVLAVSQCAGCWPLQRTPLFDPGTMQQQQQRAMAYDPYTNNDLGPEVLGGRPRDFDRPVAEAVQNDGSNFGANSRFLP